MRRSRFHLSLWFVGQAYAQRHAAAQQSQLEQTRHVALNRITPSPSPFMLVPQTLAPEQVPIAPAYLAISRYVSCVLECL